MELPALSADQTRSLERWLIEEYGTHLPQTTALAGQHLARLARRLLDEEIQDRPIVVLAGRGHKGAAGLVAARHLLDWGAWVQIVLTHPPDEQSELVAEQLAILQTLAAPLAWAEEGWELPPADLLIDALVGSGLQGDPHGKLRDLIHLANSSVAPILSLAVPSGLDPISGALATPHIQATATLVLALPAVGLVDGPGRSACGDLYLADGGVPAQLYRQLGLAVPTLFDRDTIVPVDVENGRVFVRTA